jgi:enamine deaminase RidA (YjgF/YER057c/UK114 family)
MRPVPAALGSAGARRTAIPVAGRTSGATRLQPRRRGAERRASRLGVRSGRLWRDGSVVGAGDWERQTRQAFANTATALAAAGATWADVVKLTFFVTSVAEVATVRAVRDEFVDAGRPPASSLVQVAGLVHPDLLIEVEATAWLPDLAP